MEASSWIPFAEEDNFTERPTSFNLLLSMDDGTKADVWQYADNRVINTTGDRRKNMVMFK
jgi:hypothetical protein